MPNFATITMTLLVLADMPLLVMSSATLTIVVLRSPLTAKNDRFSGFTSTAPNVPFGISLDRFNSLPPGASRLTLLQRAYG